MTEGAAPSAENKREMGLFAGFWMLVGLATLGVAAISALNVAFDLNLALGSYGSSTPLPRHWDAVGGLFVAALLIMGLSYFGSTVAHYFKNAKSPLHKVGIIVAALGLLVVTFRGLQIVALTMTYGSMLAYYCTDDGTLEDVKGELEGATPDELDACIGRTAQWDRHDFLETLFAAGANLEDKSAPDEFRSCVLSQRSVSVDYVKKAVELGVKPETCGKEDVVIMQLVRYGNSSDDEDISKKVELLLGAGFSPTAKQEPDDKLPIEYARENEMPKTVALLEAAGA